MRHLTIPDSDIIESIGFERTKTHVRESRYTLGDLEVVFKSTPDIIYRYANVHDDTFMELITAESIGKMFHEKFRKTKVAFTKSERQKPTLKK